MPSQPSTLASLRSLRFMRMALLWLALVLGLAQTVAIAHGYSHSPDETATQSAGKHPGGVAHCQSCIVAASIGGAAPPMLALQIVTAQQQQPRIAAPAAQHSAPKQRPYAIRAPPAIFS